MNEWGAAGCREHRDEIIGWLKKEAAQLSWGEWWNGFLAASKKEWFRYAAPYGSLVDEAIRRHESREKTNG